MRDFRKTYRHKGHEIIVSVPSDRILQTQQQQAEPEHSGINERRGLERNSHEGKKRREEKRSVTPGEEGQDLW